MEKLTDIMVRWLDNVALRLRTIEVCPRELNGWECKYTEACSAKHERWDKYEYYQEMADREKERQLEYEKIMKSIAKEA